jgi:uncharacterized protein YbjT (DUF2867 family)
MRVMIVGASGLIGSAVAARLASHGNTVVAVARTRADTGLLPAIHVQMDVAVAQVSDWLPHLRRIDAVVNCAGILQDTPWESTSAVHADGAAILFQACEMAGVRRIIHLSAVGLDHEAPTDFSRTKRVGDEALMASKLGWIILRPSVVIGRAAYGGSALLRGLAALPICPIVPNTGALQVIHLDDVVDAIVFFLRPDAPSQLVLELVGPKRWSFDELVRLFRRWLRLPAATSVALPGAIATVLFKLGDIASLLGWRPPIRSTARREIARGAVGDPAPLERLGLAPRDLEHALVAEPSSVQERWFAKLYLLKPLVIGVLSVFWIATGAIALGPGFGPAMALMRETGAGESISALGVIAGALVDLAIGLAIAFRPSSRYGLLAALAVSLAYLIFASFLVPRLWSDPLGPLVKLGPILVCNLVALAILTDR